MSELKIVYYRRFPCVVKYQSTLLSVLFHMEMIGHGKNGIVSYLGNVKLAKFTYFSLIYRGLMCQI